MQSVSLHVPLRSNNSGARYLKSPTVYKAPPMLTDIFSYRYKDYPIWDSFNEDVRRLLNQSISLLKEVFPYYYSNGKENDARKTTWKYLHDLMCRELGTSQLSPLYFNHQTHYAGQSYNHTHMYPWVSVCENYMTAAYLGQQPVDQFVKERLSLVEIGLRQRAGEVLLENASLNSDLMAAKLRDSSPKRPLTVPGSAAAGVQAMHDARIALFKRQVDEFNVRLTRAGAPLSYHNGFIQVVNDQRIEREIAAPFWALVADKKWTNVSIDLAEALDQRDNGGKDPALYAAKALESAIKIVSDTKGWTSGKETGAGNYIDNLVSKSNGRFIDPWEAELLKDYFRKVRNSLGHGPGSEPMPQLGREQTNWAIESAMSWTRSLIRRM
jgi:hypothetical protein